MEINFECARDVLLIIDQKQCFDYEKATNGLGSVSFCDLYNSIKDKQYSEMDVFYSIVYLRQADFIDTSEIVLGIPPDMDDTYVDYITLHGYEFLDNIRDPKVWNLTKKVISKLNPTSLRAVNNISSQVVNNLISNQIKLMQNL